MSIKSAEKIQGDLSVAGAAPGGSVQKVAKLLHAARCELGYQEGPCNFNKFSMQLGMQNVPWCAAFASCMLTQTGAGKGILKNGGSCSVAGLKTQFREAGRLNGRSTTPQPGDLVFFEPSHVGIVEKVENGRVYTIEGNTSNKVARRSYAMGDSRIVGFGNVAGEALPAGADLDTPDNLASLSSPGKIARGTGYEGSGPANYPQYRNFYVNMFNVITSVQNGASEDEIFSGLQKAGVPFEAAVLRRLATMLKRDPELLKYLMHDSSLLHRLSKQPGVSALLEARPDDIEGLKRLIKESATADSFRSGHEEPAELILQPPQELVQVPEGTPVMAAHISQPKVG